MLILYSNGQARQLASNRYKENRQMVFKQNFKTPVGKLLVSGVVVLSILLMFSVSCQTATPAPAPSPATTATTVEISGFAFVPATVTVAVGTTVQWTNNDSVAHTVSSRDDVFDSGRLAGAATFSHTFTQQGTFEYYCKFHPSMTGKVIVE